MDDYKKALRLIQGIVNADKIAKCQDSAYRRYIRALLSDEEFVGILKKAEELQRGNFS